MARSLVHDAAASSAPTTSRGLLERLFARAFEGLVYPQIWEDPAVDMAALEIGPTTRLFAIASGGCNVMSYLTEDPAEIVAVDLNRHHIALLHLKLAAARTLPTQADFHRFFGAADDPANVAAFDRWIAAALEPQFCAYWNERVGARRRIEVFGRGFYRTGLLGRTIGLAHLLARLHGRDPSRLVTAQRPQEQWEIYATTLAPLFDSWLLRGLFRLPVAYFGLGIPPAQLDAMKADAGGDIVALVRERVRRLACDFPIQQNYFAWQAFARCYDARGHAVPPYLERDRFELLGARTGRVAPRQISATEALAQRPTESLDAFVLLDAQDWMTPAQLAALWAQIARTAAPGARVIFRTAAAASPLESTLPKGLLDGWSYAAKRSRELHARDRSAIYGGFHLYQRCTA